MEDNFLSLVKSYVASEERLRRAQTSLLKKKISKLHDDLYQAEITSFDLESRHATELGKLNSKIREQKISIAFLGVCVMLLSIALFLK